MENRRMPPFHLDLDRAEGWDITLKKGYKKSDGSLLLPYQQARRYGGFLPSGQHPRWIVVCNFQGFRLHDMSRPNDEPEVRLLSCLYAEDAGIFGNRSMFHDYLQGHEREARQALINLVKILDTKPEDRKQVEDLYIVCNDIPKQC